MLTWPGQPEKFQDICTAIDKLDKVGQEGVRKGVNRHESVTESAIDKILNLITFEGIK